MWWCVPCTGEVGKFPAGSPEREAILDTLVAARDQLDPVKEQSLYVLGLLGTGNLKAIMMAGECWGPCVHCRGGTALTV